MTAKYSNYMSRFQGQADALAGKLPSLLVAADRVAATVAQGVHEARRCWPRVFGSTVLMRLMTPPIMLIGAVQRGPTRFMLGKMNGEAAQRCLALE